MAEALSGRSKQAISVLLLVGGLAVLVAPFALTAHHFGKIFEDPETTLNVLSRLTGLLAVSVIFLTMMTGSFRPLLIRVFRAGTLQSFHATGALAGFSLAIAHFLLLIPALGEHWADANRVFFVAGPLAAALLFVTAFTALVPRRFPNAWRKLHFINYAIFLFAVTHGLVIGEDRSMLAMRLILYGFLALAFLGLIYRAGYYRRKSRPAKAGLERAGKGNARETGADG